MNNDITEDYVSLEVAKLLKEKGFDVFTDASYTEYLKNTDFNKIGIRFEADGIMRGKNSMHYSNKYYYICSAPTIYITTKWIRENFGLSISATVSTSGKGMYDIWQNQGEAKGWKMIKSEYGFDSPEAATEAAFLYTFKNLI